MYWGKEEKTINRKTYESDTLMNIVAITSMAVMFTATFAS